MSVSDSSSKPAPEIIDGKVLLPPPVKPAESVLRSIAALDAVETDGAAASPKGRPASPPRPGPTIDAVANEPSAQFESAPKASPEAAAKKPPEPIQPLRANAFRPNAPDAVPKPRSASAWLARAAAIAVLLGGGWLIGSSILSGQLPFPGKGEAAIAQLSPIDQLRQDLRQVSGELAALRAQLEAPEARARQSAELDMLKKSLADISRRIEQGRTAQTTAVNEIGARIERAKLDEARHREDIADRMARLERQISDGRPTATQASVQQPAAQLPNSTAIPRVAVTPPPPQGDANAARKSSPLANYVVREVYNGMALIEGRNGFIEVFPGAMVPGAGRVQQIVRRSGQWVVVTSNGVIGPQID